MIRIDFTINKETEIVNTIWVSEDSDKHSLIGRQTMSLAEWIVTRNAISRGDDPLCYDSGSRFFKFEEKKST